MKKRQFKASMLAMTMIAVLSIGCSKDDDTQPQTETPTPPPVAEVDKVPVISAQTFTAKEDIKDDVVIGSIVATDPESKALTFTLAQNNNDLFELTAAGELSLIADKKLDYETTTSHTLTVEVSDGKNKASAEITITVENVVELYVADLNITIEENPQRDNIILGNTEVKIEGVPQNVFAVKLLSESVEGAFGFDVESIPNSIQLKAKNPLLFDFESRTSLSATYEVSVDELTTTFNVNVTLTDNGKTFINSGLIAHYTLNDNTFSDATGNQVKAIQQAGSLIATKDRFGNEGKAYNFNNAFLEISSGFTNDLQSYTISVWVYNTANDGNIITKLDGNLPRYEGYISNRKPEGRTVTNIGTTSDSGIMKQGGDGELNQWMHIVFRVTNGSLQIFTDGRHSTVGSQSTNFLKPTTQEYIYIGANQRRSEIFQGAMDDILFYNRALTDEEIMNLAKDNF